MQLQKAKRSQLCLTYVIKIKLKQKGVKQNKTLNGQTASEISQEKSMMGIIKSYEMKLN